MSTLALRVKMVVVMAKMAAAPDVDAAFKADFAEAMASYGPMVYSPSRGDCQKSTRKSSLRQPAGHAQSTTSSERGEGGATPSSPRSEEVVDRT